MLFLVNCNYHFAYRAFTTPGSIFDSVKNQSPGYF